jgi:hypothetical protein
MVCISHLVNEGADMEPMPNPSAYFGELPIAIYQIDVELPIDGRTSTFSAAAASDAPSGEPTPVQKTLYWGSAWRGLLGWELRSLLCPFPKKPPCKACLIRKSCPYFRLMEDQSEASGIQEAPRGYVLHPSTNGCPNTMRIMLTLFGESIRYVPAVLKALQNGETTGLGASRTSYRMQGIREVLPKGETRDIPIDFDGFSSFGSGTPLSDWMPTPAKLQPPISCRLLTPVRLRKKGKYLGRMDWAYFFATLIRRVETLQMLFASGAPLGRERFVWLCSQFSGLVPRFESLVWQEYSRWSNRQRKKVPMGGLIGEAVFDDGCPWLYPWLALAEMVHVGKGASMGLGKVEIGTSSYGSSTINGHGGGRHPRG